MQILSDLKQKKHFVKKTIPGKLFGLWSLLFLSANETAIAQIFIEKGVRPIYRTRVMRAGTFKDWEHFGDVFNSRRVWLGRDIFSGNISYNFGRIVIKKDEPRIIEWRHALAFYMRVRIAEEFSVNFTLYKNFNPRAVAPWTPDYTYSFGRFNWRSRTFSYGYKNYENNKYYDRWEAFSKKFLLGSWFVSYIIDMPEPVMSRIRLDPTSNIKFDFGVNYAINYRNQKEEIKGDFLNGKTWLSLASRYTIFYNIYAEGAVYYYTDPEKRQPWDPDYVYGFGYFDYRAFRVSLTYGNWVINRFPWENQKYPYYGFLDGEFRFIVNYSW